MEEILSIVLKSIVSVCVLFVLTRIMGKKQISQLTFFDYVAGISIGSIAASLAVEEHVGYVSGLTAMVVYTLFVICMSVVTLKSYPARKLLDGVPVILIQNGKILEQNLKKTKMNVNDLLEECRIKDVFDITDVQYAILETSGKLSVQLKAERLPVTTGDLHIPTPATKLCIHVIIDGKVVHQNLSAANKDLFWLKSTLLQNGVDHMEDVLLAYVDASDTLQFYVKNHIKPNTPVL